MTNPWANMKNNAKRRVDSKIEYDIFWIIDTDGKYGLCLKSNFINSNKLNNIKLKGMSVYQQTRENILEIFIILNNNEDWKIFIFLCKDLISTAKKYINDDLTLNIIENRLNIWQKFLLKNKNIDFSLQKQMGLFSELICLREIVFKKCGIDNAIYGWVGASFDKQDFLLDDMVIEVKSYKTSKTPIIKISSAAQLYSDKQPIYLISYGLTPAQKGENIDDVILSIEKMIINEKIELLELFYEKIFEYGYMLDLDIKKYNFIIDKIMIFCVDENFPKITTFDIDDRILNIKYSIDLLKCQNSQINLNKLIYGA